MPDAKRSKDERTKLRILDMYAKGASTVDLSEKFEISENTIKSWIKRTGTKRLHPVEPGAPKRRKKVQKRGAKQDRPGGPKNNSNAVGNRGGGAPIGNRNALVHGGYSPVYWDALSQEEQDLIMGADVDAEQLLLDEICLLSIRERRILKSIEKYSDDEESIKRKRSKQFVAGTVRSEQLRSFEGTEAEKEAAKRRYDEIQSEKVDRGEILPGNPYHLTVRTESSYEIIQRLEEALTRCQAQKQRCIQNLAQIRIARGDTGRKEPENNLLEALIAITSKEIDTDDIPELVQKAEHSDDLVESPSPE